MISALLFDMDGLIFDTETVYKKSWQYAATQMGYELTDDYYQGFIGVQDPDCERMLCEHFGEGFDLAAYKVIRDQHFHETREQGIGYKHGFHQLFKTAKELNLITALVTSSHLPEVKHNFQNSDYLEKFDTIITAEDVQNGKPRPDCYIMACQRLNLIPSECLVLEDSNNGMRAGKDAGCQAAMIPDITPPKKDIAEIADYLFESLEQVTDLIRSQTSS
ncbi:HAD family hydrolase [Vibrio sp. McD22-P3]|uniref:HAD family hydrolase n=1 Tax=Vibrio sp. McD22-P3 TaxID=2724880 RepID=UPI001F4510E3|nr:HAD family phosphatase [Vibrio sp. McD22-P3]MCF4172253.1 HAD family phosphatase [Vibrio sp. McD22-P3]